MQLSTFEICAGAGGQALGLEMAGFLHEGAVELDSHACDTLRLNRPLWNIRCEDVRDLVGKDFRGIDLFAGGVPCPPFSIAGKQLGADDDRDLFPAALRLIAEAKPTAVMLENVPGLATARFAEYRRGLAVNLTKLGYGVHWQVLNACNFGVPQLRPRFILVALKKRYADNFHWPAPDGQPLTVAEAISDLMGANGWRGVDRWKLTANGIAPTLVGGSKKHGGPDLGPTRARLAWRALGVEAKSLADSAPDRDFPHDGFPRLTVRMAARIQGFPDVWQFSGKKTASYRQIGNAFPPPVAAAVGRSLISALSGKALDSGEAQRRLLLQA